MNRRSFLKLASVAPVLDYGRRKTQHLIFIVNGGGARKKDYYEDPALAPNIRRIAKESFVFEEDHCESVASHDQAFGELLTGLDYSYIDSFGFVPAVMKQLKPRILVCRELAHDVGHDGYEPYLRAVQATDLRIGAIFDWVREDAYFRDKTSIVIRPEFGRDDDVNPYGELHHSSGYYYTHRVASIFWGPDFKTGIDRKTVISSSDMAPALAALFNLEPISARGSFVPGLFR
jgi:hypothetical protein